MTIPVVVTALDTNSTPQPGLAVYAFDGETYTGYSKTSDDNGQAAFTLPQGSYRFRADKNGTQFWSDTNNHCAIPGCTATSVTVTIPVVVSVLDTGGNPQAGLPVYAYDGDTYTGYNKTTDVMDIQPSRCRKALTASGLTRTAPSSGAEQAATARCPAAPPRTSPSPASW